MLWLASLESSEKQNKKEKSRIVLTNPNVQCSIFEQLTSAIHKNIRGVHIKGRDVGRGIHQNVCDGAVVGHRARWTVQVDVVDDGAKTARCTMTTKKCEHRRVFLMPMKIH